MNLDLDLESLLHEGQLNFCEAKPPYHSKICQVYQSSNLQPHFVPFKSAKMPHINLNELRTTAFNRIEKLESFFNLFWIVRVFFLLRGEQVSKINKTISKMRHGALTFN